MGRYLQICDHVGAIKCPQYYILVVVLGDKKDQAKILYSCKSCSFPRVFTAPTKTE